MKAINSGDEAGRKRGVPEGRSLGMSWFCLSLCPACPSLQCPGQVTGGPCREPLATRCGFGPPSPFAGQVPPMCPLPTVHRGKSQLLKTLGWDFSPGDSNQEG